ncbi:Hsp20/alpha crystallin family protein [Patescibacteria group bacterium]|nr:Hsp20/alpha crystallin family protein [Patescibacteria group bacterium]
MRTKNSGVYMWMEMPYHEDVSMALFSVSTPTAPAAAWNDLAQDEGQLSVDVFRDQDSLLIRSPIAGVEASELDIALHGDLLTIRGTRHPIEPVQEDDWFYRECYWGPFSRSLILPVDIYPERTEATILNGILTIRIPIRVEQSRVRVQALDLGGE